MMTADSTMKNQMNNRELMSRLMNKQDNLSCISAVFYKLEIVYVDITSCEYYSNPNNLA